MKFICEISGFQSNFCFGKDGKSILYVTNIKQIMKVNVIEYSLYTGLERCVYKMSYVKDYEKTNYCIKYYNNKVYFVNDDILIILDENFKLYNAVIFNNSINIDMYNDTFCIHNNKMYHYNKKQNNIIIFNLSNKSFEYIFNIYISNIRDIYVDSDKNIYIARFGEHKSIKYIDKDYQINEYFEINKHNIYNKTFCVTNQDELFYIQEFNYLCLYDSKGNINFGQICEYEYYNSIKFNEECNKFGIITYNNLIVYEL